jgi:hypothetical protein
MEIHAARSRKASNHCHRLAQAHSAQARDIRNRMDDLPEDSHLREPLLGDWYEQKLTQLALDLAAAIFDGDEETAQDVAATLGSYATSHASWITDVKNSQRVQARAEELEKRDREP